MSIKARRVQRSLLPRNKQNHPDNYDYALTLFNKMDKLDMEIKGRQKELDACNQVLLNLVFTRH